MEHTCAHTLAHTAGRPTLRLIHNSSSCQSHDSTGCLPLLLEQYTETLRARHLLPLSPNILSLLCVCVLPSLYLPLPHFFLSLSFHRPLSLSSRCVFRGGGDFFHPLIHWMASFEQRACVCVCVCTRASVYMSHRHQTHTYTHPCMEHVCF